jgi:hypothetical protein
MDLAKRIAILAAGFSLFATGHAAPAADTSACKGFKWDVSHELTLMQGAAEPVVAATQPGERVPELKVDRLYVVKLADESAVKFAAQPAKNSTAPGAQAGLVQFRVKRAGRYRISITSGHWVDVVTHGNLVASVGYQRHTGCERPRKIVEFDLPADAPLVLQFSGSADPSVTLAITAAGKPS